MDLLKPSYSTGYAKNASQSAHPNLWNGLVSAWVPSLGVTGETLRDVSGNGNHGTLTDMDAASDWVTTSKGLALDFDGSNDHVLIPNLGLTPNSFTCCALFKFATVAFEKNTIFSLNYYYPNSGYLIRQLNNQNKIVVYADNGSEAYIAMNNTLSTGVFCHLCVVQNGGNCKIYINGILDANGSLPNPVLTSSNVSYLGKRGLPAPGAYLNGSIAHASIYNRALSPSEIKQLYVDSLAPFRKKRRVSVAVPAGITFKPYWAKQTTQISGLLK